MYMYVTSIALVSLCRTNEEVKEEQAEFEKFWATHKSRLDHIMKTCHFRRSVEKVQRCITFNVTLHE